MPQSESVLQKFHVFSTNELYETNKESVGENDIAFVPHTESSGAGKRTCRLVVGTSAAGWTESDCDYLCDGTDDQVEINAAIAALPAGGGEIVVLDGVYKIKEPINLDYNTTLSGNGVSTVFDIDNALHYALYLIGKYEDEAAYGCTVRDILFRSTNSTFTTGVGLVQGYKHVVEGCYFYNCKKGVDLDPQNANGGLVTINRNYFINCGIGVEHSQIGNAISNNVFRDCISSISVLSGSNGVITSNVIIKGEGTPSDYPIGEYTINLGSRSKNMLVCGNSCMGKAPTDAGTNNTVVNNKY